MMIIYMWVLDVNNTYGNYDGTPVCVRAVDTAISVIWTRKFYEPGSFEIVLPADEELFRMLTTEEIIFTRDDDPTVMYAEKLKLTTDTENGDRIIISGRSIECWLDRRVVKPRENYGNFQAELLLFRLIQNNFLTAPAQRFFPLIDLDPETLRPYSGVMMTVEYFGENILDTAVSICRAVGAGLKFTIHEGTLGKGIHAPGGNYSYFTLGFVRGEDRSDTVVFSPEFGNLISTEYERDKKGIFSAAYIYESKEKKDITTDTVIEVSEETGIPARDRILRKEAWIAAQNGYGEAEYEISADGWEAGYFESDGHHVSGGWHSAYTPGYYKAENRLLFVELTFLYITIFKWEYESVSNVHQTQITIVCYDQNKDFVGFVNLESVYRTVNSGGKPIDEWDQIFQKNNVELLGDTTYIRFWVHIDGRETLPDVEPLAVGDAAKGSKHKVLVREPYMYEQGERELAAQDRQETFFGEVIDNGLYTIGKDYDLGDIVRIENAYGISAAARVTEINEVEDSSGYRIMPEFSEITIIN